MSRDEDRNYGLEIIQQTYRLMQIDDQWSTWEQNGFTWWGGGLAQRTWSKRTGTWSSRVEVRCDWVKGFQGTPEQLEKLAMLMAASTLSAVVRDPEDPTRLQLVSRLHVSAYSVWEEDRPDLARLERAARLHAWITAIQAAEAHITAFPLAELLGAEPAISWHPESGLRETLDDMLNIIEACVLPQGRRYDPYDWGHHYWLSECMEGYYLESYGDDDGMTADYPFGDRTCLLTVCEERHPRMGEGLQFRLELPLEGPELEAAPSALELNERELREGSSLLAGSWCRGPKGLTHVSFVPNVMYDRDLSYYVAWNMADRIEWVSDQVFGFNIENDYDRAKALRAKPLNRFAN